jgi:hypothetical protein
VFGGISWNVTLVSGSDCCSHRPFDGRVGREENLVFRPDEVNPLPGDTRHSLRSDLFPTVSDRFHQVV